MSNCNICHCLDSRVTWKHGFEAFLFLETDISFRGCQVIDRKQNVQSAMMSKQFIQYSDI